MLSDHPFVQERTCPLHSNVIEMAEEISWWVDPENIMPHGNRYHHLEPFEAQHAIEALGGERLLQQHKPQTYLFAVLPSNNIMHSVLFDYTGRLRHPEDPTEICPLPDRQEREDGDFETAPSSLQEPQQMNALVNINIEY